MKKLLFIPVAAAALVAMAGPASAHTPKVTAECGTLTVDLKWYEEDSKFTVTVDGVSSTGEFHGNHHFEVPMSKTAAHVWSVQIDNNGGEDDKYDQTFTGRTEACETVPTTVIELPTPVTTPIITGTFGNDCDTKSAWVQFENKGDGAGKVYVGTRSVDVPANGFARINLDRYADNQFFYGPVTVDVVNAPATNSLGDALTECVYLDTTVLNRQVGPTKPVLAFTGPGRVTVLSTIAAVLIFFGVMSLGLSHRTRKMS